PLPPDPSATAIEHPSNFQESTHRCPSGHATNGYSLPTRRASVLSFQTSPGQIPHATRSHRPPSTPQRSPRLQQHRYHSIPPRHALTPHAQPISVVPQLPPHPTSL